MLQAVFVLLMLIASAYAGEKSLYDFIWLDPDKKVYVLQNKLYKKEHSVYFDAGFISSDSTKFQDTRGLEVKSGWYFHEEWGIEGFYHYYMNTNNDDYSSVRFVSNQVPFIRRFNSSYGLLLIWSPFYGKINTFNNIYYFDWSFGTGPAFINAESNLKTVFLDPTRIDYLKETHTGLVLKTHLKFHIRENIHVSLAYMNTYYQAPSPKNPKEDKLKIHTDIILGLGFSI